MATIPAPELDAQAERKLHTKEKVDLKTTKSDLLAVWNPISAFSASDESTPSPRVGASLVYNEQLDSCILFGGASHEQGSYNDLFTLSLDDWSWHKLSLCEPLATKPESRYEHAAFMVDEKTMFTLYGAGTSGPLNDVWKFDIEERKWTLLETRGIKPSARSAPSIAYVENSSRRVYMFAGGDLGNRPVPDNALYCFDIDRQFWVKYADETSEGPSPRMGHSLTAVGKVLYVFGGLAENKTFNEFWSFDLDSKKWTQLVGLGDVPSPRSAHVATCIQDRYLLIHGGFSTTPKLLVYDDIYLFDTLSNIWIKLDTAASPPGPPGPRLDHSICLNKSISSTDKETALSSQNRLILFGGMDFSNVFNEVFELTLE